MGIRFPLKAVLSYKQTVENGAGVDVGNASTVGGVAKTFTLPQDTDNVVVKFAASIKGGGVSATFQTTDDGGKTWYDVARTSTISYAGNSVLGGAQDDVEWLSIPVITTGTNWISSVVNTGSVMYLPATIGKAGASTLSQKTYSGIPILGPYNRIFLRYTAAITSIINEAVTVYANSESDS